MLVVVVLSKEGLMTGGAADKMSCAMRVMDEDTGGRVRWAVCRILVCAAQGSVNPRGILLPFTVVGGDQTPEAVPGRSA